MRLLNSIFRLLHVNKKNWKAIVLCILAATIFWFLNSLNENYTANVSFPLKFDFDAAYYMPVEPLPDELSINVTGMGWDLFRRSAGLRVSPLVIPLERPASVKKIVGSTLPALFSGQLEGLQLNFVLNDTVYVNIEPKARRWVSLRIDSIEQYIRQGYGITGPVSVIPDSVLVEGPVGMVADLSEPVSVKLNTANIDDDFEDEIDPSFSTPLITASPSQVSISFPVEEFVELTDSIHLELVNLPSSAQPEMQIEKLPVTLSIPRSRASGIAWDSIRAVVDLSGFERGNIKTQPRVSGLPPEAELVAIDSIQITY